MISPSRSFIESFTEHCQGIPTPELFKKWAAIAAISGALERRVWAVTRNSVLIPNFIILFVTPPGIGKTRVISEVHEAWLAADKFNVAPTSVTRASIIDQLAEKVLTKTPLPGSNLPILYYRSILIAAPEFGVFCPSHDLSFLNAINDLYDCRISFEERRRTLKDTIKIPKPHITILAGTQPAFLGEVFPDVAYGMGFTSRTIMVYQGTAPKVDLFSSSPLPTDRDKATTNLSRGLLRFANYYGQVSWSPSVQKELQDWVNSGCPPIPDHSRLTNYNTRRDLHILKLCIISATDRDSMEVQSCDFSWALETLLSAERLMPDIFKDMSAGPDAQTIQDLISHVRSLFIRNNGQAVNYSRLAQFLSARIPSNRIHDIIETCIRAELLEPHQTPDGGFPSFTPTTPEF